ncbi:ribonuclease P protein component [Teredinibacter turnerae T7901]|uniref:Ribonuclease P protein component n=1 Tax=Teredinibacter turnerae (strain ATCC 39867 / T7901) TaxID=377629 RepID=C5BKL8_TERTT|nr:ribonuclease P protein component [Teredinibacter turnerae]ACR14501.1 ribonuclease P protein component [Teredinibacter turnerae T7901]
MNQLQDFRFRKSQRLLTSGNYSAVFDDAQIKASHPHFLILASPNAATHARLGLVIAKKNVRHAVDRNRLKRLIRETFRGKQHQMPAIDAIVLARRGSDQLNNRETAKILDKLWERVAKKANNPNPQQRNESRSRPK